MDAIRLQNLRSIKDTEYITIKKMNILLGKNSSGKSTFLRTFPLLKQSVKNSLRGPLLWFDSSSVDFGDYDIAKNKYVDPNEKIKFGFRFSFGKLKERQSYRDHYYRQSFMTSVFFKDLSLEISIAKDAKGTYINNITLLIDSNNISLYSKGRNENLVVKVDNKIVNDKFNIKWDYSLSHSIIPSFTSTKNDSVFNFQSNLFEMFLSFIKSNSDKRLKNGDKIFQLFTKMNGIDKFAILEYLKNQNIIPSFAKKIENWTVETPSFLEIYNLWLLIQIPPILKLIDDQIQSFFSNSSYIAPTRAEAMRFYRNQELEVSEVDAYGKNLQEFISSLNDRDISDFYDFTLKTLGVKVFVSSSMSHHSINIESKEDESFNLADVGFGYSQILPIITKLWYASRKKPITRYWKYDLQTACVVIEQPELHLHPAMQAKVADAFIETLKIAKKNDIDLRLVIETHSPTIVNRIGRRIAEQEIQDSDVNVLLFEKDKEMRNTIIKSTYYTPNGQIKNWPLGFFEP